MPTSFTSGFSPKLQRRFFGLKPESEFEIIVPRAKARGNSCLNDAVHLYATRVKRAKLKRALRNGYKARAERDQKIVQEWEHVSSEVQ